MEQGYHFSHLGHYTSSNVTQAAFGLLALKSTGWCPPGGVSETFVGREVFVWFPHFCRVCLFTPRRCLVGPPCPEHGQAVAGTSECAPPWACDQHGLPEGPWPFRLPAHSSGWSLSFPQRVCIPFIPSKGQDGPVPPGPLQADRGGAGSDAMRGNQGSLPGGDVNSQEVGLCLGQSGWTRFSCGNGGRVAPMVSHSKGSLLVLPRVLRGLSWALPHDILIQGQGCPRSPGRGRAEGEAALTLACSAREGLGSLPLFHRPE